MRSGIPSKTTKQSDADFMASLKFPGQTSSPNQSSLLTGAMPKTTPRQAMLAPPVVNNIPTQAPATPQEKSLLESFGISVPSLPDVSNITNPIGQGASSFLDAITPSRETAISIAGGLSDLGAGIAGRQGTGMQQIQTNLGRLKQNETDAEETDPNSERSKNFRNFIKTNYKDIGKDLDINEKMSYREVAERVPFFEKKYNLLMAQRAANAKANQPKEPKEKKRGIEEVKLINNAGMGLSAIQEMKKALEAGDSTFSAIGDNDFTMNQRLFSEALGRMQSGGAIGKEEEERFKAMAPTYGDSKEMRKKKMDQLYKEFSSRLTDLDVDPNEALSKRSRAISKPANALPKPVIHNGVNYWVDKDGNNLGEAL